MGFVNSSALPFRLLRLDHFFVPGLDLIGLMRSHSERHFGCGPVREKWHWGKTDFESPRRVLWRIPKPKDGIPCGSDEPQRLRLPLVEASPTGCDESHEKEGISCSQKESQSLAPLISFLAGLSRILAIREKPPGGSDLTHCMCVCAMPFLRILVTAASRVLSSCERRLCCC